MKFFLIISFLLSVSGCAALAHKGETILFVDKERNLRLTDRMTIQEVEVQCGRKFNFEHRFRNYFCYFPNYMLQLKFRRGMLLEVKKVEIVESVESIDLQEEMRRISKGCL